MTISNNDADATTTQVTTQTMVDRGILLGGQALAVGQYTCAAMAKGTVIQLISLQAGYRISTVLVYTDS
ncbi:TPA: DUF4043 family protein [Klebsiella aerogenes]|nr:DUF4043 family protein [Klebsiella aerogenes]MCP1410106.1 hypothetical protein [Klebsiella aerogenes]HBT3004659.1 DUF4043 family protein [Klebsiella aerogenes]HBV6122247.1 DUF4043 family protein [Klebsiella aerogenes]HBW0132055.1 DUF4043 family protein [Klebsiella aerogenes]